MLAQAIRCFQAQTYNPRELLIVADGEDVRAVVPSDPRMRLIHLSESLRIGEKRNFACERALGDVVCHWDDDDQSEPRRIESQVAALLAQPDKQVAGFHTMRFTDGAAWWRYRGDPTYALGTSLCYWREYWQGHRFPLKQVGEDNDFVRLASAAGVLASVDAGDLMHASIHSGNTSPKMLGQSWEKLA